MEFYEAIKARVFRKDATLLPLYFKQGQFDRPLTTQEQTHAKSSVFKVTASGQKVYLYERTHIPPSNPVIRIQV
jgi:hypothetical protein